MKGDRVPDLLETTQQQIAARLAKLRPTVEEVKRLEAAAAALEGLGASTATAPTPPRPKGATPKRRARRRRGRRGSKAKKAASAISAAAVAAPPAETPAKASPPLLTRRVKPPRTPGGTRAIQAVSLISENPGIKVAGLARLMGINRTGLYRILPTPELEGKILRRGLRWYPTGS
jgi:hypothetical protein